MNTKIAERKNSAFCISLYREPTLLCTEEHPVKCFTCARANFFLRVFDVVLFLGSANLGLLLGYKKLCGGDFMGGYLSQISTPYFLKMVQRS